MKTKILEWATLILSHWKTIVSILTFLGVVGGSVALYKPEKLVEPVSPEPTLAHPDTEKVAPAPSVVVRPCYCLDAVKEHEKKYHFVD